MKQDSGTKPGAWFFLYVGELPPDAKPGEFEAMVLTKVGSTADLQPYIRVGAAKVLANLTPPEIVDRINRAVSSALTLG